MAHVNTEVLAAAEVAGSGPLPHQPDVRHVVTPVPGVEGEDVVEAQRTRVVGMTQGARPLVRAERAQQQDPPPVDGVEEVEGDVDRRPPH